MTEQEAMTKLMTDVAENAMPFAVGLIFLASILMITAIITTTRMARLLSEKQTMAYAAPKPQKKGYTPIAAIQASSRSTKSNIKAEKLV